MLPSLSVKRSAVLIPVPNAQALESISASRAALETLEKIADIRVSCAKGDGKYCYQLEVLLLDSSSSLSSSQSTGTETSTSTTRIIREQREFADLRCNVHSVAYSAHRIDLCEFCSSVLDVLVFGSNPDALILRLLGAGQVARKLAMFLTDLLSCILRHASTDSSNYCIGQAQIPQLLHAFLFKSANC